jgi:ABC-2 type transport system permease protein
LKNTWALTKIRVRMALRSRAFIFFSMVMPLGFLFGYNVIFGRGNPEAVSFLLGAVLALTVMGSFWGLSMQLVQYRESGVLRRFRIAPVDAGALLGSSILSNYVLVLPTVTLEFVISRWIFGMHDWGNIPQVFAMVSVGAATFSSFGLIVASVTNTMQETQVINNVIWSIFLFLSGATIPLGVLPVWVQRVSLFLPATYLVGGLQQAMLRRASWSEIGGDVIALGVGLGVAFGVSRVLFRWEPESRISGSSKAWILAAMIPFLLLGVWENTYGSRLIHLRQNFQSLTERGDSGEAPDATK